MTKPLRKIKHGVWESRDGEFLFVRHESDPNPKRWFVYDKVDGERSELPINEGSGITSLAAAVAWVEAKAMGVK